MTDDEKADKEAAEEWTEEQCKGVLNETMFEITVKALKEDRRYAFLAGCRHKEAEMREKLREAFEAGANASIKQSSGIVTKTMTELFEDWEKRDLTGDGGK